MPKILDTFLDVELPDTNKVTVTQTQTNNEIDIYSLLKRESIGKKEQIGVTLSKDVVDKLKTVCIGSNMTMSKMLEDVLSQMLVNVKINKTYVTVYNEKNKAKGRRNKTTKTNE